MSHNSVIATIKKHNRAIEQKSTLPLELIVMITTQKEKALKVWTSHHCEHRVLKHGRVFVFILRVGWIALNNPQLRGLRQDEPKLLLRRGVNVQRIRNCKISTRLEKMGQMGHCALIKMSALIRAQIRTHKAENIDREKPRIIALLCPSLTSRFLYLRCEMCRVMR